MFVPFSQGYDLGSFYVQSRSEGQSAAKMSRRGYERATIEYCPEGEPLIMKLGSRHFTVDGDETIPAGELILPADIAADTGVNTLPEQTGVFVIRDPEWFTQTFPSPV